MICPVCGEESFITETRKNKISKMVKRRRKCFSCSFIFKTKETYFIEKQDKELFRSKKQERALKA